MRTPAAHQRRRIGPAEGPGRHSIEVVNDQSFGSVADGLTVPAGGVDVRGAVCGSAAAGNGRLRGEVDPQPANNAAGSTAAMVDVVLPCLDEAEALPWVLSRLPAGYRAIVADNGSTDDSARLAVSMGALVISVRQRGFGAAVAAGVHAATADVVCICDADASLDPQQLPLVAGPVLAGDADLVLGSRRPIARGAWPIHARLANRILARRMNRVMGRAASLTDLGPMRAARRCDLLALGLIDRRFGYPLEMVLRANDAGWCITEVPVDYLPRKGRSKVTGTIRGTLRTVKDMRAVLAR